MTKEEKYLILKARYERMCESAKNTKCPGAKKKAARQLRNLEKELELIPIF